MRRRDAAFVLVISVLAGPAGALKTEDFISATGRRGAVTAGQALVRLRPGTSAGDADGDMSALGARRRRDLGAGWQLVEWSDGISVQAKVASLRGLARLSAVQPSRVFRATRMPSDPLVTSQYALAKVDAFRAWEFETGASSRVTIAIVDTGVDGAHPDLTAKFARTTSIAFDPTTGGPAAVNDPLTPACRHATEVAGVAAATADNGLDVAGMSWGAQMASYKVFADAGCSADCSDTAGVNSCATNDPALIAALNQAVAVQGSAAHGRMIVNMSLGGAPLGPSSTCATDDPALQAAVSNAVAAGVVIVAAAGNDGGPVNSPGYCDGVITAGATDAGDAVAGFSSTGPAMLAHGLVAPGVSLLTTVPGGGTGLASGTSFSTPLTAGTAALLLAAAPTSTAAQIQAYLFSGADELGLPKAVEGAGRLNAYRSLHLALYGGFPAANLVNAAAAPFAFPNPFRLSSTAGVQFSVPPTLGTGGATVKIYTVDGRFVRHLASTVWDGRNADGRLVASGTYLFVVAAGSGRAEGRLAVIR